MYFIQVYIDDPITGTHGFWCAAYFFDLLNADFWKS